MKQFVIKISLTLILFAIFPSFTIAGQDPGEPGGVCPCHAGFTCSNTYNICVASYTPLEPSAFPGLVDAESTADLPTFVGKLFDYGIALAVGLALIMAIYGGIEYMTSDAWQGKEFGKEKVKGALIGLGIVLASWSLLYIVNPNLVNFQNNLLFQKPPAVINASAEIAYATDTAQGVLLSTDPNELEKFFGVGVTADEVRNCIKAIPADHSYIKCLCPNCTPGNDGYIYHYKCKNNCKMNYAVADGLVDFASSIEITEAWPPVSEHTAQCHYDGQCVDLVPVTSDGTRIDDPKEIAKMYTELKALDGVRQLIYETKGVDGSNKCATYTKENNTINCNSFKETTANHFHIQFAATVYSGN